MATVRRIAILAVTFDEKTLPGATPDNELDANGMFTPAMLADLLAKAVRNDAMLKIWVKNIEVVLLEDQR